MGFDCKSVSNSSILTDLLRPVRRTGSLHSHTSRDQLKVDDFKVD